LDLLFCWIILPSKEHRKDRVLVNAPDAPCDYPNNPIKANNEKTIENGVEALREYKKVRGIIPIQGKYMQPKPLTKTY